MEVRAAAAWLRLFTDCWVIGRWEAALGIYFHQVLPAHDARASTRGSPSVARMAPHGSA
jgi:hypothetical protein